MKYRRFGKTELDIPVFSCGGMRYQHKWSDIPWSEVPDEGQANLEATIHRAVELGINHIETARGYAGLDRGSQFHPEFKSRPSQCHPLFSGFIQAALQHRVAYPESSVLHVEGARH